MWLDYTLFLSGTLATLLIALIIDAIMGDPDWLWRHLPHPVVWFGGIINFLDRTLNSKNHSFVNKLRGILAVVMLLILAVCAGMIIHWFSQNFFVGAVLQTLLVAILLAQKSLIIHIKRVMNALEQPELAAARKSVSMIVGRNPEQLDRAGISRAAIESGAENLSDGIIAPAFWFVVAGFPGLLIYKLINTADSMIGHKNETYSAFGWATARLDDVLNLIPARLTGLLFTLVSPLVGGSIKTTFSGMMREAGWHRSPNAGWPETAMAYALNISLAGPRSYGTEQVDAPWFNDAGEKQTDQHDIKRSLKLLIGALVLQWLLYLGLYAALS